MKKFLYPNYPVRRIITGPSSSGESDFLTDLIFKIINEFDKIYIDSPSLHHDFYQKIVKCFTNCTPTHIISKIFKEEDIDIVIHEIVIDKDFQKSDTEIEANNSVEELKLPQDYDDGGNIILGDLNEKDMNDPRVQPMFKQSRHSSSSTFIINQEYCELPKRTIRANGNIYHILKPYKFKDVQNRYQDKAYMDMTFNELKYLTSTCWNEKYQPLAIDVTKDKYIGRYRLGLNSIYVPVSSPF